MIEHDLSEGDIMRKLLIVVSFIASFLFIIGCSGQVEENGDFLLYNTGFPFKANETYFIVTKTEWTGDLPVEIDSIELIKNKEETITYKEDGIKYEVYGADPLKTSGVWPESDIGDLKSIENLEIQKEGKIVFKLTLGEDVKEDSNRRVKINYKIDGVGKEKVVDWVTLQELSTELKN